MNTLVIAVLPFIISTLVSIFNKRAGYVLVTISSVVFLSLSIYNYHEPLSMFSIISSIVWIISSVFSIEYDNYGGWLSPLYSLTILGMVIILESTNYFLFLAGWEIMTIPAYIAIGLTRKEYRPSFIFMAFGELSTALILSSFIIATVNTNTIYFSNLTTPIPLIIATFGFMIKMGILPFLVSEWLPIAHGTAPSNLSAILSATMTLMGVYGILRISLLTQTIPIMFSLIIMSVGAFTVFFGALYGYINENTKGILAFSTIENNGAILVALSLYIFTKGLNLSPVENISLVTIILYSLAHSVAKSGLFLSAGLQEKQSITYAKRIRDISVGLVLLASSMSGLLPNIGGVATWLLLENLFMLSYILHNTLSLLFIASGATIAMGEGFATAMLIRYISYTSLFGSKTETNLDKLKKFPILLSGILVLLLGFTLPYLVYPYTNSSSIYGMLSKSIILTQYYSTTFGGISPFYIAVLILTFTVISYIAFGKPKIRKTEIWNNGCNDQEEYTAFGMANNIRLMLRKILMPVETKPQPTYGLDIFWEYIYKLGKLIRRFGRIFGRTFINSSISWYILYIILTLIILTLLVI